MNKIKTYITMAAAGILAAACTNDDALTDIPDVVEINPAIQGTTVVQSRATQPLATINPNAALILVYGTDKATYQLDYSGNWASDYPLYWDKLTPDGNGKYPFRAMSSIDYDAGGSVDDQSTQAYYLEADLLGTETDYIADRKEELNLVLDHKMAQLVVEVIANEPDISISTITLTVKGARPGYTGTVAVTGDVDDITPFRSFVDTDPNNSKAIFLNVLPAQTIAAGALELEFTIEVGGITNTYRWKNTYNELVFTAGISSTVYLNVSKTEVTAGSVAVTDWVAGFSQTATIVGPTDSDLSSLPKTPAVVTLKYGSLTAHYNWETKDGTNYVLTLDNVPAGNDHIYWDKITAGLAEYEFGLTFSPTAVDVVTGVKDNLSGTAKVTSHGTQPSFTITHDNSQVNVKLTKGDTYSNEEWTAITAANATTVTFTGLSTNSPCIAPYDYTETNISHIFVPKPTITATDKITVTIPKVEGTTPVSENTFEVKLENLLSSLAAGTKYDIEIVVNKTTVSVGKIQVSNWTELGGDGSIKYN